MSGRLIVFEGIDGSGKTVQTKLLADRLHAAGGWVGVRSFPDYQSPYGKMIAGGLAGRGLDFRVLDPSLVALLFMADRGLAVPGIRQALHTGQTIVCNRYADSNAAYQGARFADEWQRSDFLRWVEHAEYVDLGHPRPDLVLYLNTPPPVASRLRGSRPGTDDNNEKDSAYQERVAALYRRLATERAGWATIPCAGPDGGMLPAEAVHETIWSVVEPMFAERAAH